MLPALIADAGERGGKRFVEFFTATIRNANTREGLPLTKHTFRAFSAPGLEDTTWPISIALTIPSSKSRTEVSSRLLTVRHREQTAIRSVRCAVRRSSR